MGNQISQPGRAGQPENVPFVGRFGSGFCLADFSNFEPDVCKDAGKGVADRMCCAEPLYGNEPDCLGGSCDQMEKQAGGSGAGGQNGANFG